MQIHKAAIKGKLVIAQTWQVYEWIPVRDPIRWLKANILISFRYVKYKQQLDIFLKDLKSENYIL